MNKFSNDIKGASMIEYVLLASLVAIAAVLTLTNLGTAITNKFTSVSNTLTPAP